MVAYTYFKPKSPEEIIPFLIKEKQYLSLYNTEQLKIKWCFCGRWDAIMCWAELQYRGIHIEDNYRGAGQWFRDNKDIVKYIVKLFKMIDKRQQKEKQVLTKLILQNSKSY